MAENSGMSKLHIVRRMQQAVSEGNWDAFRTCLTEDAFYKVGNVIETRGPQAIAEYLIRLAKTEMLITNMVPRGSWEFEDAAIVEYDMQGTRVTDNKNVDYPCVDTYRFRGDLIYEWRVYPAFAGAGF